MMAAEGFDPICAVIGLPPGDRVGPTLGLASLAEIFDLPVDGIRSDLVARLSQRSFVMTPDMALISAVPRANNRPSIA